MIFINFILIAMVFLTAYASAFFLYRQKRWIGFGLVMAFLIRIHVAAILAQGLQYSFVLDSLEYEMKAWYLIQPWMNESLRISFNPGHINNYNPYDYLLAGVYFIFGKNTLIAPITNCFLATLTIYLLVRLQKDLLFHGLTESQRRVSILSTLVILAIYPSYIIWSATNIRDPLYLLACVSFLYFSIRAFSRLEPRTLLFRLSSLVVAGLAMTLVLALRGYLGWLMVASVGGGLIFFLIASTTGPKWASALGIALLFAGLFVLKTSFSVEVQEALTNLTNMRRSFSNIGFAELYARSSFGLEQSFQSPGDVFLFLPNALAHYFFGPFLWEISDAVQGLSFLETLLVILLIPATIVGIRRGYLRAPFVTTMLLAFVIVFSCSQSLVISNMGTIFRHRTFSLLLLFLFTGEGIYVFIEKNRPALLAA